MAISLVQSAGIANGTGPNSSIGLVTTPAQGNEMFALVASRTITFSSESPEDSVASGGNTWVRAATIGPDVDMGYRISVYKRVAEAAEAKTIVLSCTHSSITDFRKSISFFEFTGETLQPPNIVLEATTNPPGLNVATFEVASGVLASQPQLAVTIHANRRGSSQDLVWLAGKAPANDPVGEQDNASVSVLTGWEERSATTSFTWGAQLTSNTGRPGAIILTYPYAASWTGSRVRIAGNSKARIRMASGAAASVRLSDGKRL